MHGDTMDVSVSSVSRESRSFAHEELRRKEMAFYLPISLMTGLLSVIVAGLTLASFIVVWLGRERGYAFFAPGGQANRLFDVDQEFNLPSWYQGNVLMLCAVVLAVVAYSSWRTREVRLWFWWAVLSVGFVGLSFDEVKSIHERLKAPMRSALNEPDGLLYFGWVLPAAIIVVVLGVAFIPFLLSLPRDIRFGFLIAGALFVGGAVGMEMIGGAYYSARGAGGVVYMLIYHFEELLEMLGVVVFLRTLLMYVERRGGTVHVVRKSVPAGNAS